MSDEILIGLGDVSEETKGACTGQIEGPLPQVERPEPETGC